jgi:hypothetical protein
MQSRPEMQAEIVPMSRICPHQSSLGAIPACERVRSFCIEMFLNESWSGLESFAHRQQGSFPIFPQEKKSIG